MSELLGSRCPSFEGYSGFVVASRFAGNDDPSWRGRYAGFIEAELVEFLNQHGPGDLLLLPEEFGMDYRNAPDELRFNMADEMGDLIWFTFDVAARVGKSPADICTQALGSHVRGRVAQPITSFAELEAQALEHASDIKVINKLGLLNGGTDPAIRATSLRQHPHYVLTRTGARLCRSLARSHNVLPPYNATELEAPSEIGQATGDFLLTLAYVAKTRLGIPLEDIVRFNVAKLQHRATYGKENDIHFDQSWISSANS